MGNKISELSDSHLQFIAEQKIYFVATATAESRVNVSPKGMDTLKVLSCNSVAWLNVTGSGNETSAHIQQNPRMTIMFCAFEGTPLILRLYGIAKVVHKHDPEWNELSKMFKSLPGARQIFVLSIDLVQNSCGMAVPYFSYDGERGLLNEWAVKKGEEGLMQYQEEKNQMSIDGIPTNILAKGG